MSRISRALARRIALAAQGLARGATDGRRDRRHYRRLFTQMGVLQLDSVNVICRSHYLPAYARIGAYDRDRFDEFLSDSGEVFECWAHQASLVEVELYRFMRFRMAATKPWGRVRTLLAEDPGYVDAVYDEIAARGPLTVAQLSDPGARTGPWWGHGRGRLALDWLFMSGRIAARRDHRFGRLWDLPERTIAREHLEAQPASEAEAYRELLLRAARYHGIGTARGLADYYRLNVPKARPVLAELVKEGALEAVEVDGWTSIAYLDPAAARPRTVRGVALLSPFDPLIWARDRVERLFDFHYRIEIYVPEPKRVYGYYVLPILLDGGLVGRVDLKTHRKREALEVRGMYVEDGCDPTHVARALAPRLASFARWLDAPDLQIRRRGNGATALRRAL